MASTIVMRRAAAMCALHRASTALSTSLLMQRASTITIGAKALPVMTYTSAARRPSQRAFSTETVSFTFIDAEGETVPVTATPGQSLLDVAQENDVELEGACGGELACSTCHLVFEKELFDRLPEISEEEEDMLDLAWGLTDTSRLGCQIKVTKDLEGATIRVPDESTNLM